MKNRVYAVYSRPKTSAKIHSKFSIVSNFQSKRKVYFFSFPGIIALIIVASLSACSSNKNQSMSPTSMPQISELQVSAPEGSMMDSYDTAAKYEAGVGSYGIAGNSVRGDYAYSGEGFTPVSTDKIIMNGNISMNTDEFDSAVAYVRSLVNYYDGYTSNANLNTVTVSGEKKRRYSAVIRVPVENFGAAFDSLKVLDGVTNASQSQENVTELYTDTESRLDTRKIEEERLLSLIEKAEDIGDILSLERRLSEVRTDIELFESRLKNIDRLAAYSTINVYVYEVSKTAPGSGSDSLGSRIVNGMISSVYFLLRFAQGFTYMAAAAFMPFCILIGVFICLKKLVK